MKVKVNRNNTNWLSHLGISAIISFFILFMGLVVFFLSIAYTALKDKEGSGLGLNLIAFYYSLIIVIIEVFSSVYFWFNWFYWLIAYEKSINNRKSFNGMFLFIITPLLVVLSLDAIMRLIYVMAGLTVVGKYFDGSKPLAAIDFSQTGAIFGNFSRSNNSLFMGNFGFNVVFLLLSYGGVAGTSLAFFYSQRKKFISEEKENSNKELRANYRSLEMEKMKKKMNKQKTKDLSKKIKAF